MALGSRCLGIGDVPEGGFARKRYGNGLTGRSVLKVIRPSSVATTRVLIAVLAFALLGLAGCGASKQELEEAKQRVDSLVADNKKCSDAAAALEKEKRRVTEERQAADAKIDTLLAELDSLKKTNAELSDEVSKLRRRTSQLSDDLEALRREKSELLQQAKELKDRGTAPTVPDQPPAAGQDTAPPVAGVRPAMPMAAETKTPCDAVFAFMRASEQVVKMHQGGQRSEMLKSVKSEYDPKMKGAPQKAIQNAEAWVEELARSWDKPGDDTVFNLIRKKNATLKACGKKASDAGF
jgi:hypothetical protein